MLEILSKNNQKIKDACALKMKKVRSEKRLFLMEGIKNFDMALKYGKVKQVFTTIGLPKIKQDVEAYRVNDEVLRKLANSDNPEGIVFVCEQLEPRKDKNDYHKIVYLDQINDPGNLGTILRTAVAFNYDAVILKPGFKNKICIIYSLFPVLKRGFSLFFEILRHRILFADLPKDILSGTLPVEGFRFCSYEKRKETRLLWKARTTKKRKTALPAGRRKNSPLRSAAKMRPLRKRRRRTVSNRSPRSPFPA